VNIDPTLIVDGGVPLGLVACFLYTAMVAAAKQNRLCIPLKRFALRVLLVWILGPGTVACLLVAIVVFRAYVQ
jgi:hypothetical protein